MRCLVIILLFCCFGASLPGSGQEKEVTVGAQIWSYDRVYPLLDGLFQDTASTQLQQLVLDPNKANSTQLDALVQSFQIQAGLSQLAGVQNSVAAQMSLANLGYQSALTQQQQSLMQQSIAAQQALTKANQDLLAANQSQDLTKISAANLEVQNAQAVVNGLTAEAAIVKGTGSPWSPSAASGNIAATPTAFTSGIPSAVVNTGSSSSGPSFPATKQMDNQMDLLWSRLARVLGSMARPNSISADSRMYLIEFDTATFPKKNRKGKLLETRYKLSCGQVVDVFPRVAAVNIANTKYRDNADIFGVILSWFSFGINATYNREHLKMSQTLGQSSYITGYGVDQSVFGWKFGIPLGDNFVSSDTKRTFVLISAPPSCPKPELTLDKAIWATPDGDHPATYSADADFGSVNQQMVSPSAATDGASVTQETASGSRPKQAGIARLVMTSDSGQPLATPVAAPPIKEGPRHAEAGDVVGICFNRTTYDSTKYSPVNPVLVAVSVTLKRPIDQQATVYANGILLRRARDTFGRAIPNGIGSGGLLEESASIAQANTWIPVSPRNILITLDAGQFGSTFPTIVIVNPGQALPIQISALVRDYESATVSGQKFECLTKVPNNCKLPSLAYQLPVTSAVSGGFLWQKNCDTDPTQGCVDYLVLQAPPVGLASTSLATSQAAQVVAPSRAEPWGVNPEVYLEVPGLNQKRYRLNCGPSSGSGVLAGNLTCEFWDGNTSSDFDNYQQDDLVLQIIDQGHAGGAYVATTVLPPSAWGRGATPRPGLWGASNPQWYDDVNGGHWEFSVSFANVNANSILALSPNPYTQSTGPTASCDAAQGTCTWKFIVRPADIPRWANRVDVTLREDADDLWSLLNFKNQMSPYVLVMSSDFASWSGSNFTQVFSSSQVGTKNKTGLYIGGGQDVIPIDCPVLNSCVVTDPTKLPKSPGVMYLEALNQRFPLLQLNSDGTTQPIMYQPPKNNSTGTSAPASQTAGAVTQFQNTIVIGGSKR